jgi:hypothetical protein
MPDESCRENGMEGHSFEERLRWRQGEDLEGQHVKDNGEQRNDR